MKIYTALSLPLSASFLLMAAEADARLIKRGGASNVLGYVVGGDSIAPEASGLIIGAGIAEFVGSRHLVQTDGVPFANRSGSVGNRDEDDICTPAVCDYYFSIDDRLTVEGYSSSFGEALGVTTSFRWSLYKPTTTIINSDGVEVITLATEIAHWEPTSITVINNAQFGQIDVSLDTLFPTGLAPGLYQLGLTSTHTAPSGWEFGYLTPRLAQIEYEETFYNWQASGVAFSNVEKRRYNLTLEAPLVAPIEVSAPNQLSILGLIIGLLSFFRIRAKK
ncbi:MAG: hypothetical protein ACI9LE_002056 [Paraglaciecola sp.]|jgi:hypothetical protein